MRKLITFFLLLSVSSIGNSYCQNLHLLYLKGGDPSTWTNTGVSGNQHEEISQWIAAGYNVQTMNLTTTTITTALLTGYDVLRLNGELGPREMSASEGTAIYDWVLNGGRLLADIPYTKMVPAIASFGVQTIEGQNGGSTGLEWYFHGAPMVDGPITGPEGGVTTFASSCMDHPVLAPGNNLVVDYTKSGYPMIVHKQAGGGKVVIVFTNSWSHDADWPGNAYKATIFEEHNLEFLQKCIRYLSTITGVNEPDLTLFNNNISVKNYPNPFSTETKIKFVLPEPGPMVIKVFDIQGRLINMQIPDKKYLQGENEILFMSTNLEPGVYFLEIKSNHFSGSTKLVKIRN